MNEELAAKLMKRFADNDYRGAPQVYTD